MSDLTTTRARAWLLERLDGKAMGFTDHDRDLRFAGHVFRAGTGMSASAIMQGTGLAVDNTEAVGALTDAGLREDDILAGRFDGAKLTIWEVDWSDTSSRRTLFRGSLGEIARAGGAFKVELRGLTEPLGQEGGRVFGALCPAVLGDGKCGFDLDQTGFSAQVALESVAEEGAVLGVAELPEFAPAWFNDGLIRFLSGPAAGLHAVIRGEEEHGPDGRVLRLWTAPGASPNVGDQVRLEARCDKRFATCKLKFSNQLNFRGFPHIPGDDWLVALPKAKD